MTIDFSYYTTWMWAIIVLVIALGALRFFWHTVVGLLRFGFNFFRYFFILAILLGVLYFILRALALR